MADTQFAISYSSFNKKLNTIIGLGPKRSCVTVTDEHVRVHMGWGFDGLIPRSQIASAETAIKPRMFGWGVHGWRGTWVVNGSDDGIVKLTIDPPIHGRTLFVAIRPHTIYVSLEDPDGFLAAVRS